MKDDVLEKLKAISDTLNKMERLHPGGKVYVDYVNACKTLVDEARELMRGAS